MPDNVLSFDDTLNGDDRGMYGGGSESYFEELDVGDSEEDIKTKLLSADFTDVYGKPSLTTPTDDANPFFSSTEGGSKANVLGMPLAFNKMSDPDGRTFKSTIMKDLPLIFIVPGKTILNNKLVSDTGSSIGKGKLLGLIESDGLNISNLGVKGARSGDDLRFLGFKPNYKEYYRYVETFLSTLHGSMGLAGVYQFSSSFNENTRGNNGYANHGLCYYADKGTSISEGNSNDYTATSVAQQANDLSAKNREAKLMLGINTGGDTSSMVGKALDFVAESASKLAEGVLSLTGILSRAGNIFGRIVNGSQLLYPEIWVNSTNDKSYNLAFKFFSPYGTKDAIFKYCYVPFGSLVCLAYPVQDNVMGYGQPFTLRMSCPGWFESSMCAVQSMTFTKGGDDSLWSVDNLPLEIDVTLSIKDLYSTMPITKKYGMLSYNIGLSSFIDTMAGIRTDQLNVFLKASTWVKNRLTIPGRFIESEIGGRWSDFTYTIQNSLNNFLR